MVAILSLWAHALAALVFALLAWSAWRHPPEGIGQRVLTASFAALALAAVGVAGIGAYAAGPRLAATAAQLTQLGLLLTLQRQSRVQPSAGLIAVYGVVAVLLLLSGAINMAMPGSLRSDTAAELLHTAAALSLVATVAKLLIVQQLFALIAPGPQRTLALAIAAIALIDANIGALDLVGDGSGPEVEALRGLALLLIGGALHLSLFHKADGMLRPSRAVLVRTLWLLVAGLYVAGLVGITAALGQLGGASARAVQTAFAFGSTVATLVLVSSPRLKAWAKVMLAKHLFRHRYDYRSEWMRFTATIGNPDGEEAAPIEQRVVKAVAELVDSPGGLLLVPDGPALGPGAAWRWSITLANGAGDEAFAEFLRDTGRIVELDAVRAGHAPVADAALVPAWMLAAPEAWVVVPLPHLDRLAGAILLARPMARRPLDWEDLDLLRVSGRQAASYLAEARAQSALGEARRFDEFNRRFAFILHDIKNLVSQLSLVARNAERHADNPDFRADMVATLRDSAARMNDLLARLSQHQAPRADTVRPVELAPLVQRIASARRGQHPIAIGAAADLWAMADPARLETLLAHLVQNAIEASAPGDPVTLSIAALTDEVAIDVIDQGCGMSAGFIRESLFKPFVSSKPGGFGIGAYESRQLAAAMGGRIEVSSREGAGSRFRVILPLARPDRHADGERPPAAPLRTVSLGAAA